MTHTGWKLTRAQEVRLEKLFKQAARSSMLVWRNGQEEGYVDLANDLWVKVMESPGTQQVLESLNNNELVATLKKMAIQTLSDEQHKLDLFRQSVLYSSENVKDALKGNSTNWALIGMLPEALKTLSGRNQSYADAIKSRYLEAIVPPQGKEHVKLVRALRSLTEIINALCISGTKRDENDKLTVKDGPGSGKGKFPQYRESESPPPPARRGKGEHSDPTANQALAILKNPEIKDELLVQHPFTEFTQRPRQVIILPDGRRYRLLVRGAEVGGIRPVDGVRSNRLFFGADVLNIMDPLFNGLARIEMYRAQLVPELFPNQRPMLIHNWSAEEREMYCGIYGKAA